jgi:hypothetical protein
MKKWIGVTLVYGVLILAIFPLLVTNLYDSLRRWLIDIRAIHREIQRTMQWEADRASLAKCKDPRDATS